MADIETLQLDFSGSFTYPATAAGTLKSLSAQALIQRVELICDGKITVLSTPGWAFGFASDRTFGSSGGGITSMTAPTANANGTWSSQFYIDLMQFDGVRPKDSNLRVRSFSIVELKITFGNWVDVFTNGASAPTVFSGTLTVDANLCTEADPENSKPKFMVKRTSQVIDATNSNSNYQINLPAGNALRSIKFYTHVNGVASIAILDTMNVSNGLDTRAQGTARAFRNRLQGFKTSIDGFNEIDFARQTRVGVLASNAWAVPSPSQPVLTLGFTGQAGARIEMVITEYVRG
ncbi:MAG: hypothetical protein WAZ38_03260 [Prolixibacteraceae bacterium]